jgi:predicted translin family RNA/ssDNA-binding protein
VSKVADLARAREISSVTRELTSISRELATNCLTVELALARKDWYTVHEAAEVVKALSARFRELHRGLLVKGAAG